MKATGSQSDKRAATERAVEWVGWHLAELIGVSAPAVLAGTVSGWFALVSAAVGAGWAAYEVRLLRRQREIRATYGRSEITTGQDDEGQTSDGQDDERRAEVSR